MRVVGDRARDDDRILSTGEPQELVDLVAGNVSDDASGPVAVVEPFRTSPTTREVGSITLPVRSESQSLYDASDPPLTDQLSGLDRAAHLEALRECDRPESTRLCDGLLDFVELIKRDTAGLVGDDVLAVRQGLDRDGGTSVGNRGCDDHVDSRIAEEARRVVYPRHVRPAVSNRLRNGSAGVVGAEPDGLTALIEEALDLPEGMCMVQSDGGKSNWLTALVCCAHC
jgi:hypothetical protein